MANKDVRKMLEDSKVQEAVGGMRDMLGDLKIFKKKELAAMSDKAVFNICVELMDGLTKLFKDFQRASWRFINMTGSPKSTRKKGR